MNMLAGQPPIITALLGIILSLAWFLTGTALLAAWLKRCRLDSLTALTAAWFLWLPVAGVAMMPFALSGYAHRQLLLIINLGIVAGGILLLLTQRRHGLPDFLSGLRSQLRPDGERRRGSDVPIKAMLWLTLAVFSLLALYAAHPQRLYDQLNYHLVLAKRVVLLGQPVQTALDSHIFFCGPVEYAFAWLAALYPDQFFLISAGQLLIFISACGTLAGSLLILLRHHVEHGSTRMLLAGIVAPMIIALIPNPEIIRIAKPDALALSGSVLILACLSTPKLRRFGLILGLTAAAIAVKITFLHAALALLPLLALMALGHGRERRPWFQSGDWPLFLMGCILILAVLGKNMLLAGTPLYPADARFFSTDLADGLTRQYWREVAFGGQTQFLQSWLGPLLLLQKSWALAVLLATLILVALIDSWQRRRSWRQMKEVQAILLFLAAYTLLWPLFYRGDIFPRFVAPATGAFMVLTALLLRDLPANWHRGMQALLFIIMLAVSGVEVELAKIWKWNRQSAFDAMAQQFPALHAAEWVNQRGADAGSLILVDDPAVYFYDFRTLYSVITPRERRIWEALQSGSPQGPLVNRLVAVVREKENKDAWPPYEGPLLEAWERLAPRGTTYATDTHEILWSADAFQLTPGQLPGTDAGEAREKESGDSRPPGPTAHFQDEPAAPGAQGN